MGEFGRVIFVSSTDEWQHSRIEWTACSNSLFFIFLHAKTDQLNFRCRSQVSESQKIALVTGAARGNGLAIALTLAKNGTRVYLGDIARPVSGLPYPTSTEENLQQALKKVAAHDPGAEAFVFDVRKAQEVSAAIDQIKEKEGRLDILVNNAGVLALNPLAEVEETEWDLHMEIIAKGAFLCAQKALPLMNAQGWGRIVNIASVAGHRGLGIATAYTAAKHALVGFTRSLAMETARQNITVNCVCPGTVPTELVRGTGQALGMNEQETLKAFSTRHLSGDPLTSEDVAEAVLFLVSEKASRINGTSLFVDDGWHSH